MIIKIISNFLGVNFFFDSHCIAISHSKCIVAHRGGGGLCLAPEELKALNRTAMSIMTYNGEIMVDSIQLRPRFVVLIFA